MCASKLSTLPVSCVFDTVSYKSLCWSRQCCHPNYNSVSVSTKVAQLGDTNLVFIKRSVTEICQAEHTEKNRSRKDPLLERYVTTSGLQIKLPVITCDPDHCKSSALAPTRPQHGSHPVSARGEVGLATFAHFWCYSLTRRNTWFGMAYKIKYITRL